MTAPVRTAQTADLSPYLPRLVRAWAVEPVGSPRWKELDGSLVSVDISGFTSLAERLQGRGRAGAEELVTHISDCFDQLIQVAERHGGDVLKFRGDALLLLYTGERHAERAVGAASDMQWTIEEAGRREASVGPVELRMSAGVWSGTCHFFLVERPHRELIVAGPAATGVFMLEDLATAGEIAVADRTADELDPDWIDEWRDGAAMLRRLESGESTIPPPPLPQGLAAEDYVPAPLRAHLAVAKGEAEHRQVTVAFLKLSGCDDVIVSEGAPALLERLDRVAEAVAEPCERYGLTLLESDVDVNAAKLYLTAGAPASTGQDEEGMLRGLRDVVAVETGLVLRAGVNRGHVFTGDIGARGRHTYAVMGDAVNLAARLTARAGAGEILATADVLERARTIYRFETEPLLVKGKERAVRAHRVGEAVGVREDETVDAPLVGREREVAALRAAIDASRMRQLRIVELVGEPGIGKSRLVRELPSLALGFQQLSTAAEQYAASIPYFAFRGVLRTLVGITPDRSREEAGEQLTTWVVGVMPDLVPWLPLLAIPFDATVTPTPEVEALDPSASRDRLHLTVESFLERILMMPTLILVEDAHWLDDASSFLLRHLAASSAPRPWLICVTSRPGTMPLRDDEAATRLELEPLESADAEALALAVAQEHALSPETMGALVERAGGNPLFVRELVGAAREGATVDSLPETVESLLTTRIDLLAPADRMLLRYASVLGPSFEPELLAEILPEELEEAAGEARWGALGEFVAPLRDGVLGFRHDLVRATAYEGLSFRRRQQIHGRLGEALERRAGERAEEEASLLSLHFAQAGEHAKAWRYGVLAGIEAQDRFANVVAAELYERALVAAAGLDDLPLDDVAGVLERLGDVCERFGGYVRAEAAYGRALELVLGDPPAETRLMAKAAVVHEREGRYEDAIATLEAGLARLAAAGLVDDAPQQHAELERGLAGIRYRQGKYEEALAAASAAAAHAESAGDYGALAHALYIAALTHTDLGRDDGVALLERALPIYEELDDFRGQGAVLNNLGVHRYAEGRWDEALVCYRRSREAKERAGDSIGAAVQSNNEAEILSDQGRLVEAEPLFQDLLRACRASGYTIGIGVALSNLGRAAARSGRFEEAHELLDEAIAVLEPVGSKRFVVEARARVAECFVLEGRYAEALELATACRDAARESPFGGLEAMIERLVGYALHQARRPEEGRPHFAESLRIARELGAQFEVALTLRALVETDAPGIEEHTAEMDELLQQLGIARLPKIPLP